jgi:hypothetical protein
LGAAGRKSSLEERALRRGVVGRMGTALGQNWGQRNGVKKPWARQVSGGRGLEWLARSEHGRSVVWTGRLMGGPSGFDIFSNYPNRLKLGK